MYVCIVLSRIKELEIQARDANDAVIQQKLQHKHQIEDLQKR